MYSSLEQDRRFPVGLNPTWQPVTQLGAVNPTVHSWLVDTGSLTERIQSATDNFNLVVVGEGKVPLFDSEEQVLDIARDSYQVREVLLRDGSEPWVFARSVIPDSLVTSEFDKLGTEPLGKRLFNDVRFERGEFEICQTALPGLGTVFNVPLWGRRSCFHFQGQALLVAEIFLPSSPLYQSKDVL